MAKGTHSPDVTGDHVLDGSITGIELESNIDISSTAGFTSSLVTPNILDLSSASLTTTTSQAENIVDNSNPSSFLSKTDISLNNVDNTSDSNKPVPTSVQTAIGNSPGPFVILPANDGANTWASDGTIGAKRAVQRYGPRAEAVEVYANSSGQSNWRSDYFIGYSDAAADGNNGDSVKCYTDGAVVSGMPVENNNSLVIGTVYYLNPTVFPAVLTTTVTTYGTLSKKTTVGIAVSTTHILLRRNIAGA